MKRRTEVHFGDTYGDGAYAACEAYCKRDLASKQVARQCDV